MPRPHGVVLLLAFLVAALVSGAVLAPWLFRAGEWFVSMVHAFHHEQSPVLGWFAAKLEKSDFGKYFNRSMLISAVFWLWPFSRWAGMTKADLGLERNRMRWQDLLVGFMLASSLLLVMGVIYFQFGRFAVNPKASAGEVLGMALFAAACVALMEEWFFRGALFALLLRAMKPIPALLFLSFFFAIIHLLQPPDEIVVADNAVEAGTGFWMVGQIFTKFGDGSFLIAQGATLFMVGLIVGWARWQTKSLWLSMGLHAGWVFGIKLFAGLTRTPKGVNKSAYMPWIGEDLRIGATPLIVLSFTGLLVLGWLVLRKVALRHMPKEK